MSIGKDSLCAGEQIDNLTCQPESNTRQATSMALPGQVAVGFLKAILSFLLVVSSSVAYGKSCATCVCCAASILLGKIPENCDEHHGVGC